MEKQLLVKLLESNFQFVSDEIIVLIPNEFAKISAQEVLGRLTDTVRVLSDDIEDNKNQLASIWGSFTSDPEIIQVLNGLLSELSKKVKDVEVRQGVLFLQKPLLQSFSALTDTNPVDGEQLEKIWKDFVNSPEFVQFILVNLGWILGKIIKDDRTRETILKLINLFK